MADGTQNFAIEDIPAAERHSGGDDMWRDDPPARAAYSGNPEFTEGAETSPLRSANSSLLARPEIAEALEMTYRHSQGPETLDMDGINSDLALEGLKWLRKNLDGTSTLRRGAIAVKDRVVGYHEQRQAEEQARAARQSAKRAQPDLEETAKDPQKEHNATCKQQLGEIIGKARAAFSELRFENLTRLTRQLSSHEGPDGAIVLTEKTGFKEAIDERVFSMLQRPGEIVNDFNALLVVGIVMQGEHKTGNSMEPVKPYFDKVLGDLGETLSETGYTTVTEEIIDTWMDVIDEGSAHPQTQATGNGNGKAVDLLKPAHYLLAHSQVLANSLVLAAQKDPHAFVEQMHLLAKKGLDKSQTEKFDFTFRTLERCLEHPLASIELAHAMLYGAAGSPTQRRALDLLVACEAISMPTYLFEKDPNKLSDKEADVLHQLYPAQVALQAMPGSPILRRVDLRKTDVTEVDAFKAHAKTSEGRADTIYGRLVA